jgi:hypothetical protein
MKNPLIAARVPPEVRDRIDHCAEVATARAGLGARVIERGDVVRLLIVRALPAYEAELGVTPEMTQPMTTKAAKASAEQKGAKPTKKSASRK